MQPKEMLLVAVGAFVLTNVSIVGTLFATGYFSDETQAGELAVEEAEEEIAEEEPVPPPPPPKPKLHSMSKAWYVCEDKLVAANNAKRFSYQFDSVASRYNEDTEIYQVFIETQTASRADAPMVTSEVTCEVSAVDMSIVGYKAMKK